ncbi:PP2C family protein-serine/threonine phosphatase [Streptomyces carpinensis]|uniref:PP2C family protein-serine/threonine phosphatase n=1 Tax=Streptomyces carpinensis TaxID=66369 RepID=A0ABV1W541_9ACTN|nr:PP2C family protein-serine/threonine phosphatase [Streptomyces carpinensis]
MRYLTRVRALCHSSHALAAIPVGLILVITVADIHSPENVHLGPLLVVAPAITASFGGPRLTGLIGAIAVAAQVLIAVLHGGLTTTNHISQIIALAILSIFVVFVCFVRDRRKEELAQVRSVSEAAQRALLRPLPHRLGPLHIASSYVAAEREACIGGDLYAVAHGDRRTRLIIADVRGKGLGAIGQAAMLVGAFQEAAHHHPTLPALAEALDGSVRRYHSQLPERDEEALEHFVTALLLEVPDHSPVARMIDCGHPSPLLIKRGRVTDVASPRPAPPLGLHGLSPDAYVSHPFMLEAGDTLLLYTDGVMEARDLRRDFYPLQERVTQWTKSTPEALVQRIRRDLLTYCGGALGDDAAIVALRRTDERPTTGLHIGAAD